jgi:hypothetical protein
MTHHLSALAAGVTLLTLASPALAQPTEPPADLASIRAEITAQAGILAEQKRLLENQTAVIETQARKIAAMQAEQDRVLDSIRAAGLPGAGDGGVIQLAQTDPGSRAQSTVQNDPGTILPVHPVGEAPAAPSAPAVAAALPQAVSVLTQAGHLVVDPSLEYDRSSSNRLVFQGVEIVPGINLGLVNANSADRDVAVGAMDLRYGLTRRLEIDAHIPYVYRHDLLTTLAQQVTTSAPAVNQTQSLSGAALGDVEIAARYQINDPPAGKPFFIAGLRVKSRTGIGPYDVDFDANGISRNLATGSGFWAIEPSMTLLMPSDPVVIFATIGYLKNINRDINRSLQMGSGSPTLIGKADGGDSLDASVGFGFALNDRFSFSLGYSHSYVMQSDVYLNGSKQISTPLQVGALTMGWSYRIRPEMTINNNFEFGVTSDAPNLRIVTRMPISF